MKCTMCGHEQLKEVKIIDNQIVATEGYVSQKCKSFACEKCGHIELFYDFNQPKKKEYVVR